MRMLSLENVQREQLVMLEKAKEYLRLREETWRLRAAALQKRDMVALRHVETSDRAAVAALDAAVQAAKPR